MGNRIPGWQGWIQDASREHLYGDPSLPGRPMSSRRARLEVLDISVDKNVARLQSADVCVIIYFDPERSGLQNKEQGSCW